MALALRIISSLISVYTFLCFIRIILTWIPGMSYNKVTNILASICDPYLNLFRNIKWLTIGSFNFSPALALCLLGAASMLLTHFSHQGRISVGIILSLIVQIIWVMIHSIILFFMILRPPSFRPPFSGFLISHPPPPIPPQLGPPFPAVL